jgi:hypothetical protein
LVTGIVFPSEERIQSITDHSHRLADSTGAPVGTWLRPLGLRASLVDLVPYCRLHKRLTQTGGAASFGLFSRES